MPEEGELTPPGPALTVHLQRPRGKAPGWLWNTSMFTAWLHTPCWPLRKLALSFCKVLGDLTVEKICFVELFRIRQDLFKLYSYYVQLFFTFTHGKVKSDRKEVDVFETFWGACVLRGGWRRPSADPGAPPPQGHGHGQALRCLQEFSERPCGD